MELGILKEDHQRSVHGGDRDRRFEISSRSRLVAGMDSLLRVDVRLDSRSFAAP